MDKDQVLETEEFEEIYEYLKETHEKISKSIVADQEKIEELSKVQENNTNLFQSLQNKLKSTINHFSESCLVQLIAVLFCIVIILLLKL